MVTQLEPLDTTQVIQQPAGVGNPSQGAVYKKRISVRIFYYRRQQAEIFVGRSSSAIKKGGGLDRVTPSGGTCKPALRGRTLWRTFPATFLFASRRQSCMDNTD